MSQHDDRGLFEKDLDPDPIAGVRAWLDEARSAGIDFPEAMTLATATADSRPSARTVLLRHLDERGFVFFTNYESRKGSQLAQNPYASLVLLWKELDRQVCVTGIVERTSREESDAYFRTRPREARLGAWASEQSRVVASREALDAAWREMSERFPGEEIPLPPHWGGFRLRPETIEFWKGRQHRLHDRIRYSRSGEGDPWVIERLWP